MRMSGGYEEKVSLMWESLKHIWSQAHEHLNIPLLCFCELLFLKKKKVIYFWLCWMFIAVRAFSLMARGGYSSGSVQASHCSGFSCCGAQTLGHTGFRSCNTWAQQLWLTGSRAQAQQFWCTVSVALQHVGSSWIRDQTRVSCLGRQILCHCDTRETLRDLLLRQEIL